MSNYFDHLLKTLVSLHPSINVISFILSLFYFSFLFINKAVYFIFYIAFPLPQRTLSSYVRSSQIDKNDDGSHRLQHLTFTVADWDENFTDRGCRPSYRLELPPFSTRRGSVLHYRLSVCLFASRPTQKLVRVDFDKFRRMVRLWTAEE